MQYYNTKISTEQQLPIQAHYPERFDIDSQKEEIKNYLALNGYVVIKQVADSERICNGKSEFWNWASSFSKNLKREDPSTWDTEWVGDPINGICHYINHSDFVWNTRLLPKVKETFATIWGTDDLIVSFDAGNAYRPWTYNKKWLTKGGWWHVDQNDTTGKHKKGMVCVQGLVNYYDANEKTGGLCLIAKSHLQFKEVCNRASSSKSKIDFVLLKYDEEPLLQSGIGYLICAQAGDLILWDSRTIHCNSPAISFNENIYQENLRKEVDIIRLVSYVCMIPFNHANSHVIEARKEGFRLKKPTSHWPNEEITTYITCSDEPFIIEKCNKETLNLVGIRKKNSSCTIY